MYLVYATSWYTKFFVEQWFLWGLKLGLMKLFLCSWPHEVAFWRASCPPFLATATWLDCPQCSKAGSWTLSLKAHYVHPPDSLKASKHLPPLLPGTIGHHIWHHKSLAHDLQQQKAVLPRGRLLARADRRAVADHIGRNPQNDHLLNETHGQLPLDAWKAEENTEKLRESLPKIWLRLYYVYNSFSKNKKRFEMFVWWEAKAARILPRNQLEDIIHTKEKPWCPSYSS